MVFSWKSGYFHIVNNNSDGIYLWVVRSVFVYIQFHSGDKLSDVMFVHTTSWR